MITSIIGINMRTIVDIPDSQVKILDQVSKKKNVSRASLIREALTKLLCAKHTSPLKMNLRQAY